MSIDDQREQAGELAAHEAVDPGRLLDGENPMSPYPEDAAHWIAVYSELLNYKKEVLETTRQAIRRVSPSASRELQTTDHRVIEREAERFHKRLDFWSRRWLELGGEQASLAEAVDPLHETGSAAV